MKIYNKIRMNMSTNEVLEEDSFEYEGEIAQAGPAAVPIITAVGSAVFSAAATAIVQNQFSKDAPAMPTLPGQELVTPGEQPIEPKTGLKEAGILAEKTKRRKQGYLQSFGGLPEEVQSFGLI